MDYRLEQASVAWILGGDKVRGIKDSAYLNLVGCYSYIVSQVFPKRSGEFLKRSR